MSLRWILFIWALIVTIIMLIIGLPAIFSGTQVSGDNSIIFGFSSLIGIPAWLIIFALTTINWRKTKIVIILVHNLPAFLAAVIYLLVSLQWAR